MAEFKSYLSFYDFYNSISQWRYIRNTEQEEFLSVVLKTSESRRKELPKNITLWRAQIGHDLREYEIDGEKDAEECPFDVDRMKPLKYKASEGRANPKGISYLYTAYEKDTAIAEVRPWVGAYVSVAQLKVTKPLTLINCVAEKSQLKIYSNEPDVPERERKVWQNINEAFSKPVTQNDFVSDYVPTQIIAEMFRHNGLDGLVYKSSLCSGLNVALFDLDMARVINCTLFQVKSVRFCSVETGSQYFVEKKSL
ncbi:MAG: RES family NAD+ phosphorylase [Acidobacteria bacterium]|jgi:hypothetical protein|nr:RES family NAD+ phosphorylase [Acidobacteriota bacterium]